MTPSAHSAIFDAIPKKPATIIQTVAPGPPREMATATPAMLPSPTVPETAVARAWKWETSTASSGLEYLPRTRLRECGRDRNCGKPNQMVKKTAAPTSHTTITETSAPKIVTE